MLTEYTHDHHKNITIIKLYLQKYSIQNGSIGGSELEDVKNQKGLEVKLLN